MKIVSIFANKLYSFHYVNEEYNELNRLLDLWQNTEYLNNFFDENEDDIPANENKDNFPFKIINDAFEINDILLEISEDDSILLETFFVPLHNQEYRAVELSKRKGRLNYLRIYALKIDYNCFVVTGGAIKLNHLMEEREHTKEELRKLERCKDFLRQNGVYDNDSFFEFLNEVEE